MKVREEDLIAISRIEDLLDDGAISAHDKDMAFAVLADIRRSIDDVLTREEDQCE